MLKHFFQLVRRLNKADAPREQPEDFIDVRTLISRYSIKELCQSADDYFKSIKDWDHHLAKPFSQVDETPVLLVKFAQLIAGLNLYPGLLILDFGAGTCWTSHFLNQMGCRVISLDVSHTALRMGRALKARKPVIGDQPEHSFIVYDGKTIPVKDACIDRIFCHDAFHHLPNPRDILFEFGRILKPGGIAGFSEPGAYHSRSAISQFEMRNSRVIENDVHLDAVEKWSREAGFTDLRVTLFPLRGMELSLAEFNRFPEDADLIINYLLTTHKHNMDQHTFFLRKGNSAAGDSNTPENLTAELTVSANPTQGIPHSLIEIKAVIQNTSTKKWLPSGTGRGAVNLGVHLLDADGKLLNTDYFRRQLTDNPARSVSPGEKIHVVFGLPLPEAGNYIFEFDLVSEEVTWFQLQGSETVRIRVESREQDT